MNALFVDKGHWGFDITTIVAAPPPTMTKIPKLKLTLTTEDGRAALIEARNLP